MTTTIPFIAYEISGLAFPTTTGYYNSGAVNYKFVNALSGNLNSKISEAAAGGTLSTAFQTLTASTGIHPFTATVKVSSATAQTLVVDGYATISGNAKKGQASAQTALLDADFGTNGIMTRTGAGVYSYVADNSTQWNAITSSGSKYSPTYLWYNASAQKLTDQAKPAKASAQALKVHAFHAKISTQYLSRDSGWTQIITGSKLISYNWTFPKNPKILLQPSGLIAFGTSVYNINTVNFTVSITAAGSRILSWEAYI